MNPSPFQIPTSLTLSDHRPFNLMSELYKVSSLQEKDLKRKGANT